MMIEIQDNVAVEPIRRRGPSAKFPFVNLTVGQGFTVQPKPGKSVAARANDVRASLTRQRKSRPELVERKFEVGQTADGGSVAVKRVS